MADMEKQGGVADASSRRSSVYIDRNFQTKYALFMSGTAAVIIVILGILYAGVLAEQHELVGINAISTGVDLSDEDAELDSRMNDWMSSEDSDRLVILFVSAGVLIIALTWVSIRMTFRIVGPVRAASGMLRRIRSGDISGIRRFRKGDEFGFLADDIIDLCDTITDRENRADDLLGRAASELERLGGDPALTAEIRGRIAPRTEDSDATGQEG